ncbi:MAG: glycoside hydrolase family 32 protein [Acutalibacteraceae bacterium]|nr:glycoside hydrolase family 32 protein [Acutalibacteraceae bacterium]
MKIEIKNKYLVFPVNSLATVKQLSFKNANKTVYSLEIKLDNYYPDFYAYIDVSRFIGHMLDISVSPEMKPEYLTADEMDIYNAYNESMRPTVHFTAKNGWINDPNGLIYLDSTYHMFYQYNPAGTEWGNMHWGHAVSSDLLHWREKDIALFPDERGTMFSGCAVLDENNLLHKNDGDKKTALLYYTTTSPFCQNISYSTDGFDTIKEYEGNPTVPYIEHGSRDPKVIFCDELCCYIMALYVTDDVYCILKSDDLANWSELQRFHMSGENECPDIFPLTADDGQRKWVFIGAHGLYFIGDFDTGKFVPKQEILPLHYDDTAYAAQTFSNLDNGRIVRMMWDRWNLPASGFNGQMGIPTDMSLSKVGDKYYLQAAPIREIESLYSNTNRYESVNLSTDCKFCADLEDSAYLFNIKGGQYDCGKVELNVFGKAIRLDFYKNEIAIGDEHAPISVICGGLDLKVVVDRCSIEIFADGGKIMLTCVNSDSFCDRNLPYFVMKSDFEAVIDSIEIHSLKSIWE